jgi:hypothetical protein
VSNKEEKKKKKEIRKKPRKKKRKRRKNPKKTPNQDEVPVTSPQRTNVRKYSERSQKHPSRRSPTRKRT